MSKSFLVEAGYEVLYGHVWYVPGLLLVVEEGDQILVYVTPHNKRGACVGRYAYSELSADAPPTGLRRVETTS